MGSGLNHLARATRPAKNGFGRRRTENRGRKEVSAVRHLTSVVRLKQNWLSDDGGQRSENRSAIRRLSSVVCSPNSRLGDESNQVERAISTGQLTRRRAFTSGLSTWWSSTALQGRTCFEAGFPLRCLQRLSIPYIATLHCGWRHNRSTRDTFTPVLSY